MKKGRRGPRTPPATSRPRARGGRRSDPAADLVGARPRTAPSRPRTGKSSPRPGACAAAFEVGSNNASWLNSGRPCGFRCRVPRLELRIIRLETAVRDANMAILGTLKIAARLHRAILVDSGKEPRSGRLRVRPPKRTSDAPPDPRSARPQGNQLYVQKLSARGARTRSHLKTRAARRSAAAWRQGCLLGASDGRDAHATGGPGAPAAKSRPHQSPTSPSKRSRAGRRRQSRPRRDRAIPGYFQGRCGAERSGQRTAACVTTGRVARAHGYARASPRPTSSRRSVMTRAARLRRQNRRRRRAIVRRGRDRVVGRRPSGAGARSGSLPKVRGGGGARDDAWPPRWVAAPHRTQSASLPPPFVAARTPSATRLSGHLEGSPRPAPVGRAGRRGPRAPREAAARAISPWRKWQIV